jgi:hypothetical protein
MNLLIHSDLTPHYYSHGFGAIMNKALRLCWVHFEKYGNWNISIDDPYLNQIFSFKKQSSGYVEDLIWSKDATGPKDIDKNRLAFQNVFFPKDEILKEIFKVKEEAFSEKTLGIHARGTDKATEALIVFPEDLIESASPFVEIGYSIFLATDDVYYYDALEEAFGPEKIKTDALVKMSFNGHPIHLEGNRTEIYKEAFRAAYLLSQTDVFLYCRSNLSELALAMRNPEKVSINLQP